MNTYSYLNGISALIIVILSICQALLFINKYFKERKNLMPFVALLGVAMALFYSGPVANFFSLLLYNRDMTVLQVGMLSYWFSPISTINAMYIGFEVFDTKRKMKAVLGYSLAAIPYYIAILGWPEVMFTGTEVPGEIMDVSLASVALVCAIFYIMSTLVILVGGFKHLATRIDGDYKKRANYAAIMFLTFGVGAILDAILSSTLIFIARIIMIISIIYGLKAFYTTSPTLETKT